LPCFETYLTEGIADSIRNNSEEEDEDEQHDEAAEVIDLIMAK
jgi:hypothetical protein